MYEKNSNNENGKKDISKDEENAYKGWIKVIKKERQNAYRKD